MNREKLTAGLFLALLVNTAYVAAFAEPTIFYMGNVLLHFLLGIALAISGVALFRRRPELGRELAVAAALFTVSLIAGIWLSIAGNVLPNRWLLWTHIVTASLAVVALLPWAWRKARGEGDGRRLGRAVLAAVVLLVVVPASMAVYRRANPDPRHVIRNPLVVPTSMQEEGEGPKSPFFPSSARTNTGGVIPSNFFMDSATCGECHKDIYAQWNSSAHHFASFNNQFYRKSIEYMQDVVGTEPSKWCAGCHDHAVFFNGRFERPIKEQIDTPEAHAGLACTSCHAITEVHSSMGQADFTIEYPPLHELANSKNPIIRRADRFLTYLDPEPHRKTFMKPFMRDNSEFCASCHKVHLDVPVNDYRWFRGFNDYDNWQASGVSGQGARSFYYPKEPKTCGGCHMPLVKSDDPGNKDGYVHSHRFPAANTALPYVNKDAEQLRATQDFLKSGFITVDIFAVSPVAEGAGETAMIRRSAPGEAGPRIMSTFAVGEEAEQSGPVFVREVGEMAAPLDRSGLRLKPGSTVKVDVVVRTRAIGHFFPGGTVDAFDVWLELQARDADGRVIFWSGSVDDDPEGGKGPVEKGAHVYRSWALDGEGNPIDKRNAWQARSMLYARLIPPGAADTVHYRMHVPEDVRGPITLTAKLNHRKFSYYYTQFAYAGQPKPGQSPKLLSSHHNGLEYSFDKENIPANVSGQIKGEIPDLPITVLATDEARIEIGAPGAEPVWKPVVVKEDWERWNDWGIGLLLQGDLKGAEHAFRKVTEADPSYADGWLNVARALIREGQTDAARPFIQRALSIDASLGRIHFFKAAIERAEGDYDAALASLRFVEAKYPRDRVVLNQMARLLFLKRQYREALEVLERVGGIDPEDLQMHYTAMLCWRALGETEKAEREEALFRRFKADESAQEITAVRRRVSPEDNNERQPIHEHESVPLPVVPSRPAGAEPTVAASAGG